MLGSGTLPVGTLGCVLQTSCNLVDIKQAFLFDFDVRYSRPLYLGHIKVNDLKMRSRSNLGSCRKSPTP